MFCKTLGLFYKMTTAIFFMKNSLQVAVDISCCVLKTVRQILLDNVALMWGTIVWWLSQNILFFQYKCHGLFVSKMVHTYHNWFYFIFILNRIINSLKMRLMSSYNLEAVRSIAWSINNEERAIKQYMEMGALVEPTGFYIFFVECQIWT